VRTVMSALARDGACFLYVYDESECGLVTLEWLPCPRPVYLTVIKPVSAE
jgi:hypothetical protein